MHAARECLGAAERASAGDAVTGLDNRASFFDNAGRVVGQLRKAGASAVLVLVDIEGFRRVNLVVGHRAGDGLLCEVAKRLREVAGSHIVGRIGDDEFAVLASDVGEADAEAFARTVHEAATFDTLGVSLRSRLGYARFPRDAGTLDALLLAAESSLAQAARPDAGRFGGPAERI